MTKVHLDKFTYCPTSGKRRLSDLIADEILTKVAQEGGRLFKYTCPDCGSTHTTHCDQDRYVYYGPRTDPVEHRAATTFPMPAANVRALVQFRKANGL